MWNERNYEPPVQDVPQILDGPDFNFMARALELARQAATQGEIPVGALVVHHGRIIGEGFNRPIASSDPTAHAEIEALRVAGRSLANYRLPATTLYVTLEPCAMCTGAMVNARIDRLVFAARDIRFGAVRSKFRLADSELLNHRIEITEGVRAAESAQLLQDFFAARRSQAL